MSLKRKASLSESDFDWESDDNDPIDHTDISAALTKKRRKTGNNSENEESDEIDMDLSRFIRDSIARRNVKDGTEVVKKAKGKVKIAKGDVGGGSFQSMGLHPSLLRSLTLQGYRTPTPIQRLSIPALLASPPRDLVGMARTGSGKSLAYMIPLVQRLGGRHAFIFGARALILLPTRELALQVLKVGKELSRGWHSDVTHVGDEDEPSSSKGQSLRWGLIVGGEGMDEQFDMMSNNPDIIIATPGRLLHLIVEMSMDLKSVQYVVFDEADRLFEMGFETALNEILQRLPASRQTLLFSATLPKSLVEFAKAGLQDPKLVRLDAESKISKDLRMAFFSTRQSEKDACLLALLRDTIKVPLGSHKHGSDEEKDRTKKKKRNGEVLAAPHQTLVFVATKHHVEYVMNLLTTAGYSVSHIYGSLDQVARSYQMDQFRRGHTNVLVVTDVAARGIDIPVLENVINYDFPQGARVFVHRVGRTARAGRQGWAWSFVTNTELPYLLDLQLFLGRPLLSDVPEDNEAIYSDNLVLGTFDRESIDEDVEYVRSLQNTNHNLPILKEVMTRGHIMYERSKGKASPQSYKRAKEMMKDTKWTVAIAGSQSGIHPVLFRGSDALREGEEKRKSLLRVVNSFQPTETILEAGSKGKSGNANAALMKDRRRALVKSAQRNKASTSTAVIEDVEVEEEQNGKALSTGVTEMADEEEIAAVFNAPRKDETFRDSEFFLSYEKRDAHTEKGYSLQDGASFAEQASGVTFDLAGDEALAERKKRQLNWDKKKKKFVKGDGAGADNVKLVKTENGTRLPASYRSGRFAEWKSKNRTSIPKTGEREGDGVRSRPGMSGGKRFKHNKVVAAKPLDKLSKDFDRKSRQLKKRNDADGGGAVEDASRSNGKAKASKRYGGKPMGKVKSELKNAAQIRKSRLALERRKAKNARPSKRGKGKR